MIHLVWNSIYDVMIPFYLRNLNRSNDYIYIMKPSKDAYFSPNPF